MSNVSAKYLSNVQLVVSEELAGLLKSLAYATSWDQFPDAEKFVDALNELGIDGPSVEYNEDEGGFKRA